MVPGGKGMRTCISGKRRKRHKYHIYDQWVTAMSSDYSLFSQGSYYQSSNIREHHQHSSKTNDFSLEMHVWKTNAYDPFICTFMRTNPGILILFIYLLSDNSHVIKKSFILTISVFILAPVL